MKKLVFILILCLCLCITAESLAAGRKTDEGYTTTGEDYTMIVHRVDSDGVSIYGRLYLPLDSTKAKPIPRLFSAMVSTTPQRALIPMPATW